MANHKELDVWKDSIKLTKEIYLLTQRFPESEKYGLTSQIRRCAVSIPSNIAEGSARNSDKEFIQFLYISLGSLAELETQIIISQEIGILGDTEIFKQHDLVKREILGLLKYLKNKNK